MLRHGETGGRLRQRCREGIHKAQVCHAHVHIVTPGLGGTPESSRPPTRHKDHMRAPDWGFQIASPPSAAFLAPSPCTDEGLCS